MRTRSGSWGDIRRYVRATAGALVLAGTVAFPAREVRAGCNVIPPAVTTFRSSLGSTNKPFATPGDWVTVSLDPACFGAAPVFTGPVSDYVVSVIFTPPNGGGPSIMIPLSTNCAPFPALSCGLPTLDFCSTVNGGPQTDVEVMNDHAIRFRFPDTQFLLGFELTAAGPATIAITKSTDPLPCDLATTACADRPGLLACVDALFADNKTCDATPGATFSHFTGLPLPNTYANLCTDPSPDPCTGTQDVARFTIDAAGNILLPMNWIGVRVERDAVPVARLLHSATTVEAFPGRGVPIHIPSLGVLASYSPEGIILPPLFDPQHDPNDSSSTTFFGSTDAEQTVLRIARHLEPSKQCTGGGPNDGLPCTVAGDCPGGSCDPPVCTAGSRAGLPCASDAACPGGECGPGLFDFSTRFYSFVGPVLVQRGQCTGGSNPGAGCADNSACLGGGHCESFSAAALDPVPLEGLNQSTDVSAFSMEEAIPNPPVDLNGDGDTTDHIIKLFDRTSGANYAIGTGGSTGRAVTRIRDGAFSFSALALDGDLIAYLEPEAGQGDTDQTGDTDRFDTILKVFRLGMGELTNPSAVLPADAAPLVNRRSLALSGGRVFFRRGEEADSGHGFARASVSSVDDSTVGLIEGIAASADGRYVAFSTEQKFTTNDDPNGRTDVFVRDTVNATNDMVSWDLTGTQPGNASSSGRVAISADGNFVAFASSASDLVANDTNSLIDVFVRDRQNHSTERVSVSSTQVEANGDCALLALSSDGRLVTFVSDADNLVVGDTNGVRDVFIRDRQLGTTERVSVSSTGAEGDLASYSYLLDFHEGSSTTGGISDDGRLVVFESDATTLVPGDTNGVTDIFLRDRQANTTERVDVSTGGSEANASSWGPSISGDGRIIVFSSGATNLVAGDTNGQFDAFWRDRVARTTTRAVRPDESQYPSDGSGRGPYATGVSADGRFVSYVVGYMDMYVQDRLTNLSRLVPVPVLDRFYGLVTRDGQHVVFMDDPPGGDDGPAYIEGPLPAAACGNMTTDSGEQCDPPGSASCPGGKLCGPTCKCDDFTQDGSLSDTVLQVFDTSTSALTSLCAAADVAVAGGKAAFIRPENAGGGGSCAGGSLNGDTDVTDGVVQCWDGGGTAQNLGRAATAVVMSDDWLAALVSEAGDDKKYNSDSDKTDAVAQLHPVCGGDWLNTGQAADAIDMAGTTVGFITPEAAQGNKDLNNDGDMSDRVLQVFDTETGKLTNVGQAAAELVVGPQRLVAFRTPEASQGNTDLNGDGDTSDSVLQVFDAAAGVVLNSEQTVTPCRLEACDPRVPYRVFNDTVRFLTLECDQHGTVTNGCPTGGTDLNGDGDAGDLVVQVLNVRQACHNGSPAGACHTLASVSAGVCTTTGQACASDDACGVGGICFTPPGGCIKDLGSGCNANLIVTGCSSSQFCQPTPGGGGVGVCKKVVGPCQSDADCTDPGTTCNNSDQNFQRLMAPFSKPEISGEVFTSAGRCVEDFGTACTVNSNCNTGEFCESGTCHRRYDVCAKDADCAPGSVCKQDLDRAAVSDTDKDELPDLFDNCPTVANIMQEDTDGNGVGDACDTELIGASSLMIKDKEGAPDKRKLVLVSHDAGIVAPPPGSGADPTHVGASLRIRNPLSGEQQIFDLPSAGWKGLGNPAGVKGYKYHDADLVDGACKKVLIKPGKVLKAVCLGAQITFSLDEAAQSAIAVRLTGGTSSTTSHCMTFGGTVLKDTQAANGKTGVFKSKDAAPPATCEVP